jgi:hypothetical protein
MIMEIKFRKTEEGFEVEGHSGIGRIQDLRRFRVIACETYKIPVSQWAALEAALMETGEASFPYSSGKFEQIR